MSGFSLTFKHKCAVNQQLCMLQLLKGSSESIGCFSVRVLDCSTPLKDRELRGVWMGFAESCRQEVSWAWHCCWPNMRNRGHWSLGESKDNRSTKQRQKLSQPFAWKGWMGSYRTVSLTSIPVKVTAKPVNHFQACRGQWVQFLDPELVIWIAGQQDNKRILKVLSRNISSGIPDAMVLDVRGVPEK